MQNKTEHGKLLLSYEQRHVFSFKSSSLGSISQLLQSHLQVYMCWTTRPRYCTQVEAEVHVSKCALFHLLPLNECACASHPGSRIQSCYNHWDATLEWPGHPRKQTPSRWGSGNTMIAHDCKNYVCCLFVVFISVPLDDWKHLNSLTLMTEALREIGEITTWSIQAGGNRLVKNYYNTLRKPFL